MVPLNHAAAEKISGFETLDLRFVDPWDGRRRPPHPQKHGPIPRRQKLLQPVDVANAVCMKGVNAVNYNINRRRR